MKPQYTIAFLLTFFSAVLFGQAGVEFKVKILPGNTSYQVLALPNFDAVNGNIAGAQVTLHVPLSGFQTGTITNHIGDWTTSPSFQDMPSGNEYLFFVPTGPITGVNFEEGVEIPLFTFENTGSCTGGMELFDNDNDPLASSTTINFLNSMSILGGGVFGEAYLGNYNEIPADCAPGFDCGDGQNTIDIIDIIINSPSACGLTDGSIQIIADASGEGTYGPLQYGLEDSNGLIWQLNDDTFTDLPAGETYCLQIRHLGGFCQFDIGCFTLDAPLAAIVQAIDDTPPACGMSDGTITITAIPNPGGQLEYGVGTPPVYQSSPTITGLAAGIHPLWVRDIIANCESQIASYLLEDCVNVPCSNLDIESIGNGQYQVSLTAGETINAPNDVTESMRITVKVPTGGFQLGNVVSQVTNVDFILGTTTTAPSTSPDFDYITIELNTPNTQDIPYFEATKIPLFTFENTGTCPGDSIYLIDIDDPYLMSGADINHNIVLSGAMLNDCIGEGAAECAVMPSDCDVTFEITQLPTGEYQLAAMTNNVNLSGPMAITSGTQFTIKVPTGGFEIDDLTSLLPGSPAPTFGFNLVVAAPAEDPMFDYYTIFQNASTGPTTSPNYVTGTFIPFCTFNNIGPCIGGDIILVDNDDPTAQAVAANNGVTLGQNITVLGIGATLAACVSDNFTVECQGDPCANLTAGFQVGMVCEGTTIDFTNTTTSTEAIDSWDWEFGDANTSADESPSHIYSTSGNFEVSLTVTTNSGCEATYSEFVTVFPSPGVPATTAYTDCGTGVEITVPSAASIVWTPEDGLTPTPPTNEPTVMAHPMTTTVYTVTLTTVDGCSTQTDITVTAGDKPDWKDVTVRDVTDCGLEDGQLVATATNTSGMVEYALDPNGPWTTDTLFTGLPAGTYNVFARNATGDCPVAAPWNPLTIEAPSPFTINDIDVIEPTGGLPNGQITIDATGGNGPLQYTIVGVAGPQGSNVFPNLPEGDYTVQVTNVDGSCLQSQNVTLTSQGGNDITITSMSFPESVCDGMTGQVSITASEDIQSVSIAGGNYSNDVVNGQTLTFDVSPAVGNNSYTVMITGASGTVSQAITVEVNQPPVVSFSTATTSACVGGAVMINFTGTASTNADFQWSLDGGTITADDGNGNITVEWADGGMKNISLSVNDGGCESSSSDNLTIDDADFDATIDPVSPSCSGDDGAISVNVTGTSTYSFAWTGPGINDPSNQDQSALGEGAYSVIVTDDMSNCNIELSASLTTTDGIEFTTDVTDASDCGGNVTDGQVVVNVSNGSGNLTYELFEVGGTTPIETTTFTQTTHTFGGLTAGAYNIVVTDASACSGTEAIGIQSSNGGISTTPTSINADCTGKNGMISVDLNSGTAPYNYDYYSNNEFIINTDTDDSFITIGAVDAGSAVIIVTDVNGCVSVNSFAIGTDPAAWADDIFLEIIEPTCENANGTVEVKGVPSNVTITGYSWSHDPTVVGPIATNVPSDPLSVTIFDDEACMFEIDDNIGSSDGPTLAVTQITDASCVGGDGGIVFEVTSGADFDYVVTNGTEVIPGTGSINSPITVPNLQSDLWTVEVMDVNDASCRTLEQAIVEGGEIDASAVATPASACGMNDASIEITVASSEMFNITTDQGTVASPFTGTVTITDLYEGMVTITISDLTNACSIEIQEDLGDMPSPQIELGDFDITHAICPSDSGMIVSNFGFQFDIADTSGVIIGQTPWANAPAGTYTLILDDGLCSDQQEVTVNAPDAFQVQEVVIDESCLGGDGYIQLNVTGGNSNTYKFEWPNNESNTNEASDLSAGNYSVSIYDSLDCEHVVDVFVDSPDAALCDDCDFIFLKDTIFIETAGIATEVCLPTDLSVTQFTNFDLSLDGMPYSNVGDCADSDKIYPYNSLELNSPFQFRLEDWVNSETNVPIFEFTSIEDLVDNMNTVDPTGNWVLDTANMLIIGGNSGTQYGSMSFTHIPSGNILSIEPASSTGFTPSIFVNDEREHMLIAVNPNNPDCSDTLIINLLTGNMPSADSIFITVGVGEMQDTCLDISELGGTLESINNECLSFTNNAQWLASGSECITIEGLDEGSDEFCMVLCDDNGVCDTTYVIVEVEDGGGTGIQVLTGFSPNGDGINDYFKINNIDDHPVNDVAVFNRWGNRVYKKKKYSNDDPWRGEYENQILPDGTYFYLLDVEVDGEMKSMKGYVQIRR